MKILVSGSRNGASEDVIRESIKNLPPGPHTLIHGNAKGVDSIFDQIWKFNNWPILSFPADWENHGKAAGPIRNQSMINETSPDYGIFIPDLSSKGTYDCLNRFKLTRRPGICYLPMERCFINIYEM